MTAEEASRLLDSHVKVLAEHFEIVQIVARLPFAGMLTSRKGGNFKLTLAERFWSKVDKSGGPDACWPWCAHRTNTMHGTINIGGGKREFAHRLAWILTNGPIAKGLCVCHKCDFPPCCNPSHFFLGTKADNTADMVRKGRARGGIWKGEENGNSKLDSTKVEEIRRRYENGESQNVLAREFGVYQTNISCIVRRKTWRQVA